MSAGLQGYDIAKIAAGGAPLAKVGATSVLGKALLFVVPAVLVGAALGYGLLKAFDVRWDELSLRAADGESTFV